jgi:hypothetical protein
MAGIKISDLPPNTLPLVGDEQLELQNADGDSTRATVDDVAAAAAGLDATFVTVTANAQLPNERILTEGAGISIVDNGAGNSIVVSATSGGLSGLGEWRSRTETVSPPASGQIRFNNADPELATELYIAETNDGGTDVETFLALAGVGSLIYIQEKSDSSNFILVEVATNVDSGTFRTIGIANIVQQGSPLSQNTRVILVINVVGSGAGDVFKVGTPVDDQIGVWTGDGTIEGDSEFLYDGFNVFVPSITLGGASGTVSIRETVADTLAWRMSGFDKWRMNSDAFFSAASDGAQMNFTGASLTDPTLLPRSGDLDTGIGSASNDDLSIIAGGLTAIRVSEGLGVITMLLGGDTAGTVANAFGLINETASATNPTLLPNRAEDDTGIGQNASGEVSIIGGGVELARAVVAASGGLLANNLATGAGLERVLTTADLSGGGGDVFKVGTPVDNQVGVWTGDGTIEGDVNFLWDGTMLSILSAAGVIGLDFFSDGASGNFRTQGSNISRWIMSGWAAGGPNIYLNSTGGTNGLSIHAGAGTGQHNVHFSNAGGGAARLEIGADPFDGTSGASVDFGRRTDTLSGLELRLFRGDDSVIDEITLGGTLTIAPGIHIKAGMPLVIDALSGGGKFDSSHDNVDFNTVFTTTTDWNITGLSGRILQGAETLAFVSEIGGGITIEDEGVPLVTVADTLDFVGAGVTATGAGGTKTITIPGGGGGDVTKVGTPVDNQVGVWTGDGTIEGTTGLTYDGSVLEVAGTIQVSNAAGSAMLDEAATSTNPTLVPNRADPDTGISGNGVDQLFLVAGAVQMLRATEVPGARQIIITPGIIDNNPALPALAFGDGDTGIYETFDDTLSISCLGAAVAEFNTNFVIKMHQDVLSNNGVGLAKIAATSTIPNILPNVQDEDSGIGWTAADALSVIAGGVEGLRLTEASSRIIQTNANHVGLTASVTQTQVGGLALLSSYNEIATVANSGDALTAFEVAEGARLVVVNNGANDLQLFPASGDDIGAGTDASITIAAGAIGVFLGRTAAIWDTLYNAISSPTSVELPEFQFFADQLENPNNADWTVNALAPASADSNNAGLTVRLFDDTVEEGVGFTIEVPSGATNIVFDFVARAETAPGVVNTVGLDIYNRGIPDNAAVQAWSVATALTDIDIPTNEFFQEDTQSVALATLGVTAGETTQFELVRTLPGGGTDLTGDWDLLLMKVSFT